MTENDVKTLQVGDRVLWDEVESDSGTVVAIEPHQVIIKWDMLPSNNFAFTHPADMAHISRVSYENGRDYQGA